ncbi:diphosphomevalonate decarboxylase [Candidatus Roizmanbacteria bacterium RIFCSPLOWO2_02_FULL_37_19]|nr:MAG: diphosphomevalonate decarboxylase [Candidatus Roizmanbacteria bacterium RIFCSPHIGHO2_01_FULL_38_41]OGK54314.1 MAG: diphosphomevalonate decarboxylase [Candidatus Roizmanbacteria bacterium RIFCSPLOWO2_02_FULL_37_19]OGK61871.1 MAG: diphosphomevalonate decarboxylase [Candidatus Roizmanbacteria bacterium RIFCSPLOWO2_12_FULL_37_7b]
MKATAIAPSNLAFIKYWGKKKGHEEERLPVNGSISMNLSNLITTTTVEFSDDYGEDVILYNGEEPKQRSLQRVLKHLDRIRLLKKFQQRAQIVSKNNFPESTGLSSSASGFAALSLAASKAANLDLSEKDLSILARQGSGSACRSIPDGFVEWLNANTSDGSYAKSIFPHDYWNIVDIVVITGKEQKDTPTSEGMKRAYSSPFFKKRLQHIEARIIECKRYIKEKNFKFFGELIEKEALEMHTITLTSQPPIVYWHPGTLCVMRAVHLWRQEGLESYFTINTGHNIHVIVQEKDKEVLAKELSNLEEVNEVIINYPAQGAQLSEQHLF